MKKMLIALCWCFLGLGATTAFAQQGNIAAGGNASGSGGTASFSIGQVFYSSPSGTTHKLIQGLQQPYEISVVSGLDKSLAGINLTASVYPNPSVDKFTLKVENISLKGLNYGLFDSQGKQILQSKVEADESAVEVGGLPNGAYLLKVYQDNLEIKIFKIIKVF
ncbi:MAG: hypothetical protein CFE21_14725 [Bacteroidetes bacterium B1(2017)]|nr:MAG: hypothetical protein CFE21_14725 [Bacteroidetes bacterium B1(2017)]